jgi:hypothetical protein
MALRPKAPAKRPPAQSKTAAKTARVSTKSNAVFSSTDAASDFFAICRNSIRDEARAYVRDRAGKLYLTLDPVERHLRGPVNDVSAQLFKDNFSHFSSLIKIGLCFRISPRGSNGLIYARKHTKYRHPLEHVIEQWHERLTEADSTKQYEANLLQAIKAIDRRDVSNSEEVLKAVQQLKRGIARLAIGHHPFDEGQLSENGYRVNDEAVA